MDAYLKCYLNPLRRLKFDITQFCKVEKAIFSVLIKIQEFEQVIAYDNF